MDPYLYFPLFMTLVGVLGVLTAFRYIGSSSYALQEEEHSFITPLLLCIFLVVWLGYRPAHFIFGDTVNYAFGYNKLIPGNISIDWSQEWVWEWITVTCKSLGLSVKAYFLVAEAGYILSVLWAIKKFTPSNPMLGILFVIASLMFYQFGVNGVRNGLACHLIFLAMAFAFEDKYGPSFIICLIAFGIHRSVALPVAAFTVGYFFKDKVKYALLIWLLSIPLSLVLGGTAINFFASLGFDDRMTSYTDGSNDMSVFASTGFRWDFLLYSFFPILMIWYVCIKRQIVDYWYNVLAITYCLCNAFWVMVITAAYSNRFAYLSWFMYPVIIAYPLINLPIWDDQDRKTGLILLAYVVFTLFMNIFFWG